MKCKKCGGGLDLTMASCPACGAEVELGRLTGILGIVCRGCDAYNDPGTKVCLACGKPLGGKGETPAVETALPAPAAAAPGALPAGASVAASGAGGTATPDRARDAGTPVVRSFPRGGAGATRFVPAAALRRPAPEVPAHTPIPLVARCPRCGAAAGQGAFCASCGQALGARGTQVMARPAAPGRAKAQVFGALAPGRAKLVLERGEGYEGATFGLDAEKVEAGRATGAVLFPSDPCLAPHHATFFYRDGALHVRDEGAPGGVYLRLRGLVPLRPGDHFAVGDRLLRYAGPLPPPPPSPPDGTRRLGAPRPAGAAVVLEEWLEGGGAGRVFVRGGPSVTIGRAGCAVNLGDDPLLSQAHAELLVEAGGGVRLRDLGSWSGTYVRLPPHAERELRDGDTVRMGREVLRVEFAE